MQAVADGLQHRLEVQAGGFLGLAEAGVGAFEEGLLRVAEQLVGDVAELRGHDVLRLAEFEQARFERLALCLERRDFGAGGVAVCADRGEVEAQAIGVSGALGVLGAEGGEVLHRGVALALDRVARGADEVGVGDLGLRYGELAG